jgi:hypothetical protein
MASHVAVSYSPISPPEENCQSDPEEATWDPTGPTKRRKLTKKQKVAKPQLKLLATYTSSEQTVTYTPTTSSWYTPLLPEENGTHTSKVKTGHGFDVWYQSRIAPLDRGEDWHRDPACMLSRHHGGPRHNFTKIWIDRRTGQPIPGQRTDLGPKQDPDQHINSQAEVTKM